MADDPKRLRFEKESPEFLEIAEVFRQGISGPKLTAAYKKLAKLTRHAVNRNDEKIRNPSSRSMYPRRLRDREMRVALPELKRLRHLTRPAFATT